MINQLCTTATHHSMDIWQETKLKILQICYNFWNDEAFKI